MFAQQYFAHVGPQGESAITVASSVGYTNLALGENLALGLYAGDAGVVPRGWIVPVTAQTFWTRNNTDRRRRSRRNVPGADHMDRGADIRQARFRLPRARCKFKDQHRPFAKADHRHGGAVASDKAAIDAMSRNPVRNTTHRWRITTISSRNTTISSLGQRPPSPRTTPK